MDKEMKNEKQPPKGYTPESWERQRMLSRFLQKINSDQKPSEEIKQWWMNQY